MKNRGRLLLIVVILIICFIGIGYIFWQQEIKYILPTPVPQNYVEVKPQSKILPDSSGIISSEGPYFLHFFNPDCPCSRFNLKHFNYLATTYGKEISFAVIIPDYADTEEAGKQIPQNIPVYKDVAGRIALACGVYSSPQAVIVDKEGKIYFRGNYNKSRYCTQKDSNYAELALLDYLNGRSVQDYGILATRSYGCEFKDEGIFNLIKF